MNKEDEDFRAEYFVWEAYAEHDVRDLLNVAIIRGFDGTFIFFLENVFTREKK